MRLVVALIVLLIVNDARAADPVFPSSNGNLKVQTVASGLVNPWSLAFLPDGRMLVTERPGRMRIVAADGRLSPPIANVPKVYAVGQAGLMDVLLARDFAQSHTIFVCYAEAADGGGRIAVLRARLSDDELPQPTKQKSSFDRGDPSRGVSILVVAWCTHKTAICSSRSVTILDRKSLRKTRQPYWQDCPHHGRRVISRRQSLC